MSEDQQLIIMEMEKVIMQSEDKMGEWPQMDSSEKDFHKTRIRLAQKIRSVMGSLSKNEFALHAHQHIVQNEKGNG